MVANWKSHPAVWSGYVSNKLTAVAKSKSKVRETGIDHISN